MGSRIGLVTLVVREYDEALRFFVDALGFELRDALFLETGDFEAEHARLLAARVRFAETPRAEPYGRVAVFEDLYGNRWDLVER